MPDICAVCGVPSQSKCSRCRAASYCSSDCQAKHWKAGHKKQCTAPPKPWPAAPSTSGAVLDGPDAHYQVLLPRKVTGAMVWAPGTHRLGAVHGVPSGNDLFTDDGVGYEFGGAMMDFAGIAEGHVTKMRATTQGTVLAMPPGGKTVCSAQGPYITYSSTENSAMIGEGVFKTSSNFEVPEPIRKMGACSSAARQFPLSGSPPPPTPDPDRTYNIALLMMCNYQVTCMDVSPCGRYLAAGFCDPYIIRVSSLKTGKLRCTALSGRAGPNPGTGPDMLDAERGHRDEVLAIAWSPDGSKLATGSADCTLRIWSPTQGALELMRVIQAGGEVPSLVFRNDGKAVATARLASERVTQKHGIPHNHEAVVWAVDDAPPPTDEELEVLLRGMSVKKLKSEARARRVSLAGCLEKSDIISALLVAGASSVPSGQDGVPTPVLRKYLVSPSAISKYGHDDDLGYTPDDVILVGFCFVCAAQPRCPAPPLTLPLDRNLGNSRDAVLGRDWRDPSGDHHSDRVRLGAGRAHEGLVLARRRTAGAWRGSRAYPEVVRRRPRHAKVVRRRARLPPDILVRRGQARPAHRLPSRVPQEQLRPADRAAEGHMGAGGYGDALAQRRRRGEGAAAHSRAGPGNLVRPTAVGQGQGGACGRAQELELRVLDGSAYAVHRVVRGQGGHGCGVRAVV